MVSPVSVASSCQPFLVVSVSAALGAIFGHLHGLRAGAWVLLALVSAFLHVGFLVFRFLWGGFGVQLPGRFCGPLPCSLSGGR